jgi:hypothetical protein
VTVVIAKSHIAEREGVWQIQRDWVEFPTNAGAARFNCRRLPRLELIDA